MADSLEDFARRRREEAGAPVGPVEREAARRAAVRSNVRRARLLPLVFGAVISVSGLVAAAWASAIALGLDVGPPAARLSLAITAVTFVGMGAFLVRFSGGFHVHLTSPARAPARGPSSSP